MVQTQVKIRRSSFGWVLPRRNRMRLLLVLMLAVVSPFLWLQVRDILSKPPLLIFTLGNEKIQQSVARESLSSYHDVASSSEADEHGKAPMTKDADDSLPDWLGDEWKESECIPFSKWQVKNNEVRPSTCNLFHEMDVSEPGALQFIACGGARCAFSVEKSNAAGDDKIVLKWTK